MSTTTETVTFNLELNVEQAFSEVRKYETVLFRTLGLMRRAGLPEDMKASIMLIEQLIMSARMLQTAIAALNVSMATSPAGVVLGGMGIMMAGVSAIEAGQMYMRRGE